LKQSPYVHHLSLYDVHHVKGVAADLSHIESRAKVTAHQGKEELGVCLEGSDVVVISAGAGRKPGMSRDDLFTVNARVVAELILKGGRVVPNAMFCIITSPINSTVPVAAEILKRLNVFNPARLFGVTTLDVVRANTFVALAKGLEPHQVNVPVVGGHSGSTIIPIISQCVPDISFPPEERYEITRQIQNAGTDVVEAKAGFGSANLSMAYAGNRFVQSLLSAMTGRQGVIECAFVHSHATEVDFFSTPLLLGENGVQENFGVPHLLDFELTMLKAALPELKANINKGTKFGREYPIDD
jgi:malate dehydrogenase